MTGKFANYTVALLLAMLLNRTPYITNMIACYSFTDSDIKRFFCRTKQRFYIFRDLTDTKCIARISVETVKNSTAVYRNNIAIFQYCLGIRHPVHHNFIH